MVRPINLLPVIVLMCLFVGCKHKTPDVMPPVKHEPVYTTTKEFKEELSKVATYIHEKNIIAYHDSLDDGMPDKKGETSPLIDFVNKIIEKIDSNDIEGAVHDVYHFDGTPFSLISYLMKAYLAEDITAEELVSISAGIPLPPQEIAGFLPPQKVILLAKEPEKCTCKPKIKIKATWAYRSACGNRIDTVSGYPANNTLNDMRKNTMFRFDPEIDGCACGGTFASELEAPDGAGYGFFRRGNAVVLMAQTGGTYKITFTYTCGCGCGQTATETFTISF